MKTRIAAGIVVALLLLLVAVAALSGYFGKKSTCELRIVDINVETPKPSLLHERAVTIDHGEFVTLRVTVKNKGEAIIRRNAYRVGVEIVYPEEGTAYWKLPAERLIAIDMGPGGKSSYAFSVRHRKELPVSGIFKLRAYIKSAQSDEQCTWSDTVTIELRPQAPTPAETPSSGFDALFVIIGLMTVRYLIISRKT